MVSEKELLLGLFAQNVKKNAKFRLNPAETDRYIARNAFQGAREPTHLKKNTAVSPEKVILLEAAILINGREVKTEALKKRKNRSFEDEKNVVNLSFKPLTELKKEATWRLEMMVGMAGGRERCIR